MEEIREKVKQRLSIENVLYGKPTLDGKYVLVTEKEFIIVKNNGDTLKSLERKSLNTLVQKNQTVSGDKGGLLAFGTLFLISGLGGILINAVQPKDVPIELISLFSMLGILLLLMGLLTQDKSKTKIKLANSNTSIDFTLDTDEAIKLIEKLKT